MDVVQPGKEICKISVSISGLKLDYIDQKHARQKKGKREKGCDNGKWLGGFIKAATLGSSAIQDAAGYPTTASVEFSAVAVICQST